MAVSFHARITITGASEGIGAEMARQLAAAHQEQLQITLAARNQKHLQAVQRFGCLKEDAAMPAAECALLIIRGMNRRQSEVMMSRKSKLGRWLKLIAPGWVEDMALAALKDEVRPH